ncbi:MAG: replication factor C large subunit [Halobacteriales archaeon]
MADWTEKHRPSTLSEVRGNDKARDRFEAWARNWPEDGRAVVLAGSPGVGKTSAAHALANDMGWEAVEVNASDRRRADEIERLVGRAAVNTTLGGEAGRQLLIVDEADSFHGNADRGGASALVDIVNEARQPVVLIVNDEYEMPDSLRRDLEVVEFRDVSARSILPVLRDLCRREGIEYDDDALEALAEKNAGDLRSAVNDLQAIAEDDGVLRADDVVTGERDRTNDVFEFLDAVIKEEDAEGALRASYDVDETPDDLIAWIEDNTPKDYAGEELADAYGFLANADRWLGRVRATQEYAYWRYASDNMTAGVAAARDEPKGGWTRYGPPSYWSKLGRSRGSRETRDAIARAIAATSGCSMSTARRAVMPALAAMTHHCHNRELTVAMAAAYDLDAGQVAFVTGSGEDTNKVQSIVEDAEALREDAAVAAGGDVFEPAEEDAQFGEGSAEADEGGDAGEAPTEEDTGEDGDPADDAPPETQSGLSDFT